MKTAIGYIRVSTDKQVEHGVSLAAQVEKIETYCALHDIELLEILEDKGLSGKSVIGRPAMKQLLKLARQGAMDTVVTCKLDRMFRSTVDAITIIPELQALGVATHIMDLGGVSLDTSTPMGGFFLTMAAAFGELERKQIGERTRNALRHKRDHGQQYSSVPPFGWDYVDGERVENQAEQYALYRICILHRIEGRNSPYIAERLRHEGYKTRGGKLVWLPGTIRKIIKHPLTVEKFDLWATEYRADDAHAAESDTPHGRVSPSKLRAVRHV